jgi:Xaa-Pro dipeptidase
MTIGVGTKTKQEALDSLSDMTTDIQPFSKSDFEGRIILLQEKLREAGAAAAYLHAGTNLFYFTGLKWNASERMVAAIVPADGDIVYVAPQFELDTLRDYWQIPAEILAWEEHECPYALVGNFMQGLDSTNSKPLLIDEVTPFFIVNGIQQANPSLNLQHAQPATQSIRSRKSSAEIAIIKRAHEMTLAVHAAAASILKPGIKTTEVVSFIDEAHRHVGAKSGSYFCIVLFGVATSFPHGVKDPQILKENDEVLFDTGCLLQGYNSDITRSFTFGTPTDRYREIWDIEKAAQIAAFDAAKIDSPCEVCDQAARDVIAAAGYGPDYQLPGLPHRTGHGCGLDIHEGPFLVRGEKTPLATGMVFSSEPMMVMPGEFGIRLEDHFYMSDDGPVWFTEPSKSVDDPFGT